MCRPNPVHLAANINYETGFKAGMEFAAELLAIKMGENEEGFKDTCSAAWNSANQSHSMDVDGERTIPILGKAFSPDAGENHGHQN